MCPCSRLTPDRKKSKGYAVRRHAGSLCTEAAPRQQTEAAEEVSHLVLVCGGALQLEDVDNGNAKHSDGDGPYGAEETQVPAAVYRCDKPAMPSSKQVQSSLLDIVAQCFGGRASNRCTLASSCGVMPEWCFSYHACCCTALSTPTLHQAHPPLGYMCIDCRWACCTIK